MKRTLRTKIWCVVLVVACVSGVAFGVANLPRVQAEAVSGGVEVTEAPGNEAVVSEESKAEVPEISGNPEISEVSETAEVSSAKEEFESHFTADEKLDFSKIPKIVRTEDGSISIENGDGSFDAENDPYFSASSIYGGKNVKATIKDVHMSNKLEYGLTPADNDCFVPWWINGGYPWLETCELNEDGTLSSPHYAFAYVTIGFENIGVDANIDTSTHGNEASFEFIVDKNPDYIFAMDRDAAIGTDGAQMAQEILENELVKSTDAYQNGHVVYLAHPNVWYTAEGGIQALSEMLSDLENALL